MSTAHTEVVKARLRAALTAAMRAKAAEEVKVLRALLAAIDDAEAPPVAELPKDKAEIARLTLTPKALRAALQADVDARRNAAADFAALGLADRAAAAAEQADLAERHVAAACAE